MLSDDSLDVIFRSARTHKVWLDRPVPDDLLRRVYDLARLGPTSANCSPMRVLFLKSGEAKERLRPSLNPGNVDKAMQAPVTVIVGHAVDFFEELPRLFPAADMRANFAGKPEFAAATAFRNGSLQGRISCWRRGRSAWTAAPCRASTTPRWTRSSFPRGG